MCGHAIELREVVEDVGDPGAHLPGDLAPGHVVQVAEGEDQVAVHQRPHRVRQLAPPLPHRPARLRVQTCNSKNVITLNMCDTWEHAGVGNVNSDIQIYNRKISSACKLTTEGITVIFRSN